VHKKIIIAGLLLSVNFIYAQGEEYAKLIKKADSLYYIQGYKKAATTYSKAFETIGWKGTSNHHYNASCSWAMANLPDSSFYHLEKIARSMNFKNYDHIIKDSDLEILHNDKRWKPLIELVKQNKDSAEAKLNIPLTNQLIKIYNDDQLERYKTEEVEKEFGVNSKELKALWKVIAIKDSVNIIAIKKILDTYGWLGADVVGDIGNSTLFLVIQHADLKTQEHYLPMMREAVKKHQASVSDLALLEDRIEIRNGRKQIYGSQISMFPNTLNHFVSPLIDPDNVDKRRAQVGLGSLADYISYWNLKWDAEQYKKDLPKIEAAQQKY
jgi:hypothetical protein